MAELLTLSWRAYPAASLVGLGLAAAIWSAYRGVRQARRVRDPQRALALMRGFRLSVVGLAVAALGLAWWWQIGWLLGLALVIGGEELLESSVVIAALQHAPHTHDSEAAASAGRDGRFAARDGRLALRRSGDGVAAVAALAAQQHAQ
jgi:hypothetical protein